MNDGTDTTLIAPCSNRLGNGTYHLRVEGRGKDSSQQPLSIIHFRGGFVRLISYK